MIRWTQRFGLRTRMLIVALILCLAFASIVIKSAVGDYAQGVEDLRHQSEVAATLLAAEQRSLELATKQLLFGLALATSRDDFASLLGGSCTEYLRQLARANPVFSNIGVVSPDGVVVCSSEPSAVGVNVSDRSYFFRAAASHSFVVSEPFMGRVAKRATIVAAQPLIRRDDAFAGVLYAALDLGYLAQSMARQALPVGTHVLLVDRTGTTRLRIPDEEGLTGQLVVDHEAFAARIENGQAGFGELMGPSGARRMVAYAPLASSAADPLFVWVGIPLDRVRAAVIASSLRSAALYALVLAGILAMVWWGVERIIVGPVIRLTAAAQRLGHGDLSARTGVADDGTEIGVLASSFDRLAIHVQRITRALRTLSAGNHTLLHATEEPVLLQRMCDVAVSEGHYESAAVFMVAGDGASAQTARLVAQAGRPARTADLEVSLSSDDDGGRQKTVRAVLADGVPATDRRVSEDIAADVEYGSIFSAPLRFDEKIIGTLTFTSGDRDAFGDEEAAVLSEMAADLSFGVTNLRVRAALTASALRANRARLALSAGNKALAEGLDEFTLLHRICHIAVDHGGYVIAYVTYVDPPGSADGRVVASHTVGDTGAGGESARPLDPEERRVVEPTLTYGTVTVLHDLQEFPMPRSWSSAARRHPIRAALTMPLHDHDALIGALTVLSSYDPSFEPAERELLGELAQDISLGIASSRSRIRQEHAVIAIKRATTHDAVTGLPALAAMITELDEVIAEATANAASVAVLSVFFPRLGTLFRSLGYSVGSRIASVIAVRLLRSVPTGARVGRTHTDEFAIVVADSDAGRIAALVDRLRQSFDETIEIDDAPLHVPLAVGASFFPGHGDEGDLLLRNASLAAREVGRRGTSYMIYTSDLTVDNPARLRLAGELRGAIDRRELVLHYQPKISLSSGEVSGVEALVRWQHVVHGLLPPGEFVPIAEQTGQIRELSYLILELAVRQINAWSRLGIRIPVAVNLSAHDLHNPQLTERVEGLLATWGVPASLLHFEVTETALLEDPEAARQQLKHFRDLGSEIYIDDFGTGYSSLNYLVTLPVHALKIDRSFIVQMATRSEAATVVASIISMAHGLGLRVVAEGVESPDDRAKLASMDCDEIQGYLISRPLPADELVAFL